MLFKRQRRGLGTEPQLPEAIGFGGEAPAAVQFFETFLKKVANLMPLEHNSHVFKAS